MDVESLPTEVLARIFGSITSTGERNKLSTVCRHFHDVERLQRWMLKLGNGLDPAREAVLCLCRRFPYLKAVEVSYSGWISKHGKQMDDEVLTLMVENCPLLQELSLSYCCFITDIGMGNLACCRNLQALRLYFMPRIGGIGLLTLFSGRRAVRVLELNRCMNLYRLEWLEHLGSQGCLTEISICNCRGIGEGDLVSKLGCSWDVLRKLVYEVDEHSYRFLRVNLPADCYLQEEAACRALEVLKLRHCMHSSSGKGLASVLSKCTSLVELELDLCLCLRDVDLISLAEKCSRLKSLVLKLPPHALLVEHLGGILTRPSDASLECFSAHCQLLEEVVIGFGDEFPSVLLPSFSGEAIAVMVQSCCSLKKLVLEKVYSVDDWNMVTILGSRSLAVLKLIRCQEVGDAGIGGLAGSSLKELWLRQCLGITDAAFCPLLGTQRLEVLAVEDCPRVSEEAIAGAAKAVHFRRDFSWIA